MSNLSLTQGVLIGVASVAVAFSLSTFTNTRLIRWPLYFIASILLLITLALFIDLIRFGAKVPLGLVVLSVLGQPLYSIQSLFQGNGDVKVDFVHHSNLANPEDNFYVGGTPLSLPDFPKQEAIFVTGGYGQNDALLIYNSTTNRLENHIIGSGLEKTGDFVASFGCCVFQDIDNALKLIIARRNGVFLYSYGGQGKFSLEDTLMKQDKSSWPIGVSVGDIDRSGRPCVYISRFIAKGNFVPNQFNSWAKHAVTNLLLQRQDNGGWFNITPQTNTEGHRNTFTAAFIDLTGDGYPSIVCAHDSSKVEILHNIPAPPPKQGDDRSKQTRTFKSYMFNGYGFFMGIAPTYGSGNLVDLFLSNMGPMPREMGRGDLRDDQMHEKRMKNVYLSNQSTDSNLHFKEIADENQLGDAPGGWGALFSDVLLDGSEQLLMTHNFFFLPPFYFSRKPNSVWKKDESTGKYKALEPKSEFGSKTFGCSVLRADLTGNGRQDTIWLNVADSPTVYLNRALDNNFINVTVPQTLRYANARIELESTDMRDNSRHIQKRQNILGGIAFASGMSCTHQFGLGKHLEPIKLLVKTIYGDEQVLTEELEKNINVKI